MSVAATAGTGLFYSIASNARRGLLVGNAERSASRELISIEIWQGVLAVEDDSNGRAQENQGDQSKTYAR